MFDLTSEELTKLIKQGKIKYLSNKAGDKIVGKFVGLVDGDTTSKEVYILYTFGKKEFLEPKGYAVLEASKMHKGMYWRASKSLEKQILNAFFGSNYKIADYSLMRLTA